MLLVRRALVRISRRDGDAVNPHFGDLVEEARYALRFDPVEQSGVDVHSKPARLRQLDRGDGPVINAALADRAVVIVALAVEVDRPGKIGARSEQLDLL